MRLSRVTILLLAIPSICAASEGRYSATPPPEVSRQVIILVQPGVLDLGASRSGTLADAAFVAPGLQQILERFPIERIGRAFPDAQPSPPTRRNRDGVEFRDTDLSLLFELRLATTESREDLIAQLNGTQGVVYAEKDFWAEQRFTPDDPSFARQWGMQNVGQYGGVVGADIHVSSVWTTQRGSGSDIIGIVDGGTDPSHVDFGGRVFGAVGSDYHATHVAGIAAATGNNGIGVAGANWACGIRSDVMGNASQSAGAIHGAVDAGAKILNNSWGQDSYCSPNLTVMGAIAYANKNNALCIFAMPETGHTCDYPNAYVGSGIGPILNVGATDNLDQVASYSFAKPYIDIVAPGGGLNSTEQGIYSTLPSDTYDYLVGTSMAAPHATGAASLLRSYAASIGISLYNDDLYWLLRFSATDLLPPGFDEASGMGRLNTQGAVSLLGAPNAFAQQTAAGGAAVSHWSSFQGMTFYQLPGYADGNYLAKQYTVERDVSFAQTYPSPPQVWGRGAETIGYSGATANWCTGYAKPIPGTIGNSGCRLRTFVYEVRDLNGTPIGWFPTTPDGVVYAWSELYIAPAGAAAPSAENSFYVPQTGSVASPTEGAAAISLFRACPNNDGGASLPNNARVKVVVRDNNNQPMDGVSSADVYVLLNGGTAAQGFSGDGADSVIANSTWNQNPLCPDLRLITSDGPTDATGTTFITFRGATPGSPGVATRDSTRKWGHYDSELPVYVLGTKLQGRLTSSSANGTYVLQVKNFDFEGGLGATMDVGEAVEFNDYSSLVAHLDEADSANPKNWWRDFNSDGFVNFNDLSMFVAHLDHTCAYPNNP